MNSQAGAYRSDWINLQHFLGRQDCPECGSPMRAADWLKQKDVIYVWYRCSKLQCKGSYLEKLVKQRQP